MALLNSAFGANSSVANGLAQAAATSPYFANLLSSVPGLSPPGPHRQRRAGPAADLPVRDPKVASGRRDAGAPA